MTVQTAQEIKTLVANSYALVEACREELKEAAPEAANVLRQIANDPDITPSTRARAAETIIRLAGAGVPEQHNVDVQVTTHVDNREARELLIAKIDAMAEAQTHLEDVVEAEVVEDR